MTDLERQAEEYAYGVMKRYPSHKNWKIPVEALIAEAYEQGWVDRDTRDVKHPESLDEFLDIASDCAYFHRGYCKKALPDIVCERSNCVAYTPKNEKK